ncbi:hypothetical protein H9633_10170 [Microbacterium sp. Re1]|uniref:Uncharacterized protein n=1 Tax=Microbacterium commune TaxID=2762219 RepID=A0ABR8W6L2_9MICO|nr:hypothetical protein [Microbacterium commune]MBD8012662.1 hypothetical protein [Microbacterium commune]
MNDESHPKVAPEDLAGGSISLDSTAYFGHLRISRTASDTITGWVDQLAAGTLSLTALPASLFALYELGVTDGRQQMEPELQAAKLEADRLWLRCFGEAERREYLLDRLDRAASLANRPDVDDVLDEAWRIYCASLNDVRAEVSA